MLRLIWDVSLILAGVAIAIMLLLVVVRLVTTWRRDRLLAARRRLAPLLLGQEPASPDALRDVSDDVVTQLTLDLIQLVRGTEREAFVEKAITMGIPPRLARQSRSPSQRQRMVAVQGLAMLGDTVSRDALRRALGDGSVDIRLVAALALAQGGEPFNLGDLVRMLELGDGQPSLMAVNLFRLFADREPDQVQALVRDGDQSRSVRLAAVEALAATGDYRLVPDLAELGISAEDGSEELPRYLHALGKLGHPAARDAVLAGLDSGSMAARVAAAGAAGRIALVEAGDQLVILLDAPEWWVRFRAAEALFQLGEPGLARLRAAAKGDADRAREAAAAMLAERGIAP